MGPRGGMDSSEQTFKPLTFQPTTLFRSNFEVTSDKLPSFSNLIRTLFTVSEG